MSYLKSLTSKDVIVTPFKVHKQFSQDIFDTSDGDTEAILVKGRNTTYPLAGGKIGTGSRSLVYNSIKQLYYSNYLTTNNGRVSNVGTASFNPDGSITGPRYTPNYINNIQSIDELRIIDKEENDYVSVASIPTKLFGETIKPGSFSSTTYREDGQGNIINAYTEEQEGNIIYEAGIIAVNRNVSQEFRGSQWESTTTIYETQYKCTIRANEFNYSLNPSLITDYGQDNIIPSGSSTYKGFVTGSDFSPYVTTVGLYDDEQNLLAVGKLAQPLQTSQTTDTTILINIDR
jgi:hypothetical protein